MVAYGGIAEMLNEKYWKLQTSLHLKMEGINTYAEQI